MINILYVFDDNYAPHAGVSITSLLFHNRQGRNEPLRIFCTAMTLSGENRSRLESLAAEYGQTLSFIDPQKSIDYIESCETGFWNGSKATWLKVFCLWELPEDVDKILYIDSDTLITGEIAEIEAFSLGDAPLAMAYDSLGNTNGKKNFGLSEYRNAGVILFSVTAWRNTSFREAFIKHFRENVKRYKDNEQGLLNDFFRGRIALLPFRLNRQGFLMLYDEAIYRSVYDDFPFYSNEEIRSAKEAPVICHFFRIFGDYPWESGNLHPDASLYEAWRAKSLWKDVPRPEAPKKSIVFRIEKLLFKLLPRKAFLRLYRWIVER